MSIGRSSIAIALAALFTATALAQTTGSTVQRDVNQQERIEQGLQSASLNTREAAKLENQEKKVDRLQAKDLKDGSLSPAEKAQLEKAQNRVSADIYKQKHDAQTGNPNSASSKRMQADVQRNVNQQARIEQGVKSGELTNRETASLERGQAHVNRAEAVAGADGHVAPLDRRASRRARIIRARGSTPRSTTRRKRSNRHLPAASPAAGRARRTVRRPHLVGPCIVACSHALHKIG